MLLLHARGGHRESPLGSCLADCMASCKASAIKFWVQVVPRQCLLNTPTCNLPADSAIPVRAGGGCRGTPPGSCWQCARTCAKPWPAPALRPTSPAYPSTRMAAATACRTMLRCPGTRAGGGLSTWRLSTALRWADQPWCTQGQAAASDYTRDVLVLSSCRLSQTQLQARCGVALVQLAAQLPVKCAGASGGAVTAEGLSPRDNPQVEHLCPLFVSQWWLMLPTCRMFIRPLQSA